MGQRVGELYGCILNSFEAGVAPALLVGWFRKAFVEFWLNI